MVDKKSANLLKDWIVRWILLLCEKILFWMWYALLVVLNVIWKIFWFMLIDFWDAAKHHEMRNFSICPVMMSLEVCIVTTKYKPLWNYQAVQSIIGNKSCRMPQTLQLVSNRNSWSLPTLTETLRNHWKSEDTKKREWKLYFHELYQIKLSGDELGNMYCVKCQPWHTI